MKDTLIIHIYVCHVESMENLTLSGFLKQATGSIHAVVFEIQRTVVGALGVLLGLYMLEASMIST